MIFELIKEYVDRHECDVEFFDHLEDAFDRLEQIANDNNTRTTYDKKDDSFGFCIWGVCVKTPEAVYRVYQHIDDEEF